MESIEKLRELNTFGTVKVDGDLVATNMLMVCATKEEIDEIAEESEAEIDSRYMLLPCDADGVPIRIGDTVREMDDCVPMKVMSLTFYEDCVDVNACGMNPKLLFHVKPRTIEDVLRDLVDGIGDVEFDALTAIGEAADEIRELMEVD